MEGSDQRQLTSNVLENRKSKQGICGSQELGKWNKLGMGSRMGTGTGKQMGNWELGQNQKTMNKNERDAV
jgi:hypothetical protein